MLNIAQSVRTAQAAGVDSLHIDIMDGCFAEDFGFNIKSVRGVRALTPIPIDVHLMVSAPERFVVRFAAEDISCLYIHSEAAEDTAALLRRIRAMGRRAGLAISPETPPDAVAQWLPLCDEVLVMTVAPGCGGAAPDKTCIDKIRVIRQMAGAEPLIINVDGGINMEWARKCVENGASKIVAGTAFFGSDDPAKFCKEIKDTVK